MESVPVTPRYRDQDAQRLDKINLSGDRPSGAIVSIYEYRIVVLVVVLIVVIVAIIIYVLYSKAPIAVVPAHATAHAPMHAPTPAPMHAPTPAPTTAPTPAPANPVDQTYMNSLLARAQARAAPTLVVVDPTPRIDHHEIHEVYPCNDAVETEAADAPDTEAEVLPEDESDASDVVSTCEQMLATGRQCRLRAVRANKCHKHCK